MVPGLLSIRFPTTASSHDWIYHAGSSRHWHPNRATRFYRRSGTYSGQAFETDGFAGIYSRTDQWFDGRNREMVLLDRDCPDLNRLVSTLRTQTETGI